MPFIISDSILEYLFVFGQRAFVASGVGFAIPQQPHDSFQCDPLSLLPYESCSPPNQS